MQDLLLAILVDKEPIKLAPSSSQIPALLAKTKQNIFDVRAQQQAAQRYQQRFQPRPSSGGSTPRDVVMGEVSRRDSQVSVPGPPALLPTASGINLAAEVDQVNADTAPGNVSSNRKHLHHVETRFYCPGMFLSLEKFLNQNRRFGFEKSCIVTCGLGQSLPLGCARCCSMLLFSACQHVLILHELMMHSV